MSESEKVVPEYSSRTGAELLKARLEAYWRSRGKSWEFWLTPCGREHAGRRRIWGVRSNVDLSIQ